MFLKKQRHCTKGRVHFIRKNTLLSKSKGHFLWTQRCIKETVAWQEQKDAVIRRKPRCAFSYC